MGGGRHDMLRMNFLVVLLYWVSSFHGCTNTDTMLLHTVGEVTHVVMSTLRVCFGEHRLERDNRRLRRCCYARCPHRLWMNKTRSRKGREKLPLMLWVWLLLACLLATIALSRVKPFMPSAFFAAFPRFHGSPALG